MAEHPPTHQPPMPLKAACMPCLLLAYCMPTPPLGSTSWTQQPVRVGGTCDHIHQDNPKAPPTQTKPWVDELRVTGMHTAGLLHIAAETGTGCWGLLGGHDVPLWNGDALRQSSMAFSTTITIMIRDSSANKVTSRTKGHPPLLCDSLSRGRKIACTKCRRS